MPDSRHVTLGPPYIRFAGIPMPWISPDFRAAFTGGTLLCIRAVAVPMEPVIPSGGKDFPAYTDRENDHGCRIGPRYSQDTDKAKMRVGYIFNHAEIVGGGEISFIDLAGAIRAKDVEPIAIVPGEGQVHRRLTKLQIQTEQLFWPPITPSSLIAWPRHLQRTAGCFSRLKMDLIHVNGARSMLYCGPAARRMKLPCVWHVRVMERDRWLDRIRAAYASVIVANSQATAKSLSPFVSDKSKIKVVYNGFDGECLHIRG